MFEVNYQQVAGLVSAILIMANMGWYLLRTIRGEIRPHVFTNLVNGLVTLIVFVGMLSLESGPAAWRTGLMGVLCILVAAATARQGIGYVSRSDVVMLVAALAAIPIWKMTESPDYAIAWILFIEASAVVPSFRKAYELPHEDSPLVWSLSGVSQLLALVALENPTWSVVLYFVIWVFMSFGCAGIMVWRRRVV